jgi:hypothetical protein
VDRSVNRSAFIRQYPDLTPQEVMELGEDRGISMSKALVYMVRKAERDREIRAGGQAKASPALMPSGKMTKTGYIRMHPDLPAGQVVQMAAKQGMTLTANFVYMVRSDDRKKAKASLDAQEALPEATPEATPFEVSAPGQPPEAPQATQQGLSITLESPDHQDTYHLRLKAEERQVFQVIMARGTANVRALLDDIDAYLNRLARGYQETP